MPGQQVVPVAPVAPVAAAPAPKKKGKVPLAVKIIVPIAVVILVIVGIVLAIFLGASATLNKAAQADYYTIGADQIPSVKLALGSERKVISTNTAIADGATTKTIKYQVSGTSQNKEMSDYLAYLHDKDGFYTVTDIDFSGSSATGGLGRNSKDSGQEILLQIEYDTSGYTITIVKQKGSVTPNGGGDSQSSGGDQSSTNTNQSSGIRQPSITPAAGWERDTSTDYPSYRKGTDAITLMTQDMSAVTITPEEFAKQSHDASVGVYGEQAVTDVTKEVVDGYDAFAYSYSDGTQRFWNIFIFQDTTLYEIDCNIALDHYSSVSPDVQSMIDSFTLTGE